MEYVILVVGLSAVGAAWDGVRRAISASAARGRDDETIKSLVEKTAYLESGQLALRSHIAELKNFLSAQKRQR